MGVIQAKRNQSTAEFITSAINLRAFSVKVVAKFPKKYTFYGLHHTYELAQLIVDDLVRANSLYFAKDKTENYKARHDLFDKALGNLNCLSTHIVYLFDLLDKKTPPKEQKVLTQNTKTKELWQRWGSLINETKKLVLAIRDSDTCRLKNLGA